MGREKPAQTPEPLPIEPTVAFPLAAGLTLAFILFLGLVMGRPMAGWGRLTLSGVALTLLASTPWLGLTRVTIGGRRALPPGPYLRLMGLAYAVILACISFSAAILAAWTFLFMFAPGLVIPIGCSIAAQGWTRRVGRSEHCPKCDYEIHRAADQTAGVCSECGANWSARRLVRGRLDRSRPMILTGAIIGALGLVLIGASFASVSRVIAGVSPTPMVIEQAMATAIIGDGTAWGELSSRNLTIEQKRSIARRLVEQRDSGLTLSAPAEGWLTAAMRSPDAAGEMRERYYAGMLVLSVGVVERNDREMVVGLAGDSSRRGVFGSTWIYLWVFEARADGESVERPGVQRPTRWVHWTELEELHQGTAHLVRVPGPARSVTVIGCLAAAPAGATPPVPIQAPDGAITVPGALWSQRFELTAAARE